MKHFKTTTAATKGFTDKIDEHSKYGKDKMKTLKHLKVRAKDCLLFASI